MLCVCVFVFLAKYAPLVDCYIDCLEIYGARPITELSLGRFLFPPAHRESHLWCKSIIKANQYWIFSRDYTVLDMCGSLSNGIMGSMWADSLCVGQIC